MSKFSRRWLALFLFGLVCIACVFALEFALRYTLFTKEQRSQPDWPRRAFETNQNQYFVGSATFSKTKPCTLEDLSIEHPAYLLVFTTKPPCAPDGVNRFGFRSPEFPEYRSPKFFSILILGGSVADISAAAPKPKAPSYMEQAFTSKWLGPNGQPIRVFNAGLPGDQIPTQESILLRHGHVFDAVIALDGANELVSLRSRIPLGSPSSFPYLWGSGKFPWRIRTIYSLRLSLIRNTVGGWLSESVTIKGLTALLGQIAIHDLDRFYSSPEYYDLYEKYFILPASWTEEEVIESNIQRYVRYTGNLHAIARNYDLLSLHVVQPITAVAKPLSEIEKTFAPLTNWDLYRRLESAAMKNPKNTAKLSLVEIFKDTSETVYSDQVHPLVTDANQNDNGYTAMTNKIAEAAAQIWNLQKKP